jgi:hypothetical protein
VSVHAILPSARAARGSRGLWGLQTQVLGRVCSINHVHKVRRAQPR